MRKISMLINAKDKTAYIHPEIYGHFAEHLGRCIYDGIYVGENSAIPNINGIRSDIVEAFRQIRMPLLRWPGGSFADEYDWKKGVGEKSKRKPALNTCWGGITKDNSFGTHEFMELCELIGCQPYITGNVGSGTVRELAEWVEYMTFDGDSPMANWRKENGREKPWRLKYLGIGNENWGSGGNMRPEYYADEYRRYQCFCKNFSGNELFKIACGPSSADYNWMEVMMKNLDASHVNGIALHYYIMPVWPKEEPAAEFDDKMYYKTIACAYFLDELIHRHTAIMNHYDPYNKIKLVVDEWGCWHESEKSGNHGLLFQQNTMRDAIAAAISLNIFNRHSKRVVMANLAQAVNVLQALILTENEKMVKTPTYHVFDLYKEHQGGEAVYCFCENVNMAEGMNTPMISSSASIKDNIMTITLANCSIDEGAEICCSICNFDAKGVGARILTNDAHAYNDFDAPDKVVIEDYQAELKNGILSVKLPACSVAEVRVRR